MTTTLEQSDIDLFFQNGFILIRDVIEPEYIEHIRSLLIPYIKEHGFQCIGDGHCLSELHKELKETRNLLTNKTIISHLNTLFKDIDMRFLHRVVAHLNTNAGWHYDANTYVKNVREKRDNQSCHLYKVCFFFQDHTYDYDCLKLIPNSHLHSHVDNKVRITLHPQPGDIIIFDQRLYHAGNQLNPNISKDVQYLIQKVITGGDRLFMNYSLGADNDFTKEFLLNSTTKSYLRELESIEEFEIDQNLVTELENIGLKSYDFTNLLPSSVEL